MASGRSTIATCGCFDLKVSMVSLSRVCRPSDERLLLALAYWPSCASCSALRRTSLAIGALKDAALGTRLAWAGAGGDASTASLYKFDQSPLRALDRRDAIHSAGLTFFAAPRALRAGSRRTILGRARNSFHLLSSLGLIGMLRRVWSTTSPQARRQARGQCLTVGTAAVMIHSQDISTPNSGRGINVRTPGGGPRVLLGLVVEEGADGDTPVGENTGGNAGGGAEPEGTEEEKDEEEADEAAADVKEEAADNAEEDEEDEESVNAGDAEVDSRGAGNLRPPPPRGAEWQVGASGMSVMSTSMAIPRGAAPLITGRSWVWAAVWLWVVGDLSTLMGLVARPLVLGGPCPCGVSACRTEAPLSSVPRARSLTHFLAVC